MQGADVVEVMQNSQSGTDPNQHSLGLHAACRFLRALNIQLSATAAVQKSTNPFGVVRNSTPERWVGVEKDSDNKIHDGNNDERRVAPP